MSEKKRRNPKNKSVLKNELAIYRTTDHFTFRASESLKEKCNAPKDKAGVYLIYRLQEGEETLLYIGASGYRKKDGSFKVRGGGMYDRLINGYHPNRFGSEKRMKRHIALPLQMLADGIEQIKVYWWVTYDAETTDFPTDVEHRLMSIYKTDNDNKKPPWHNSDKLPKP